MSQEIKSGAGADLATVDPTSKALRVTQYKSDGTLLNEEYLGEYMCATGILTSAALATTVGLFHIRNGATRVMKIKAISVTMCFAGTAAATTFQMAFDRYNAASTTPTGGTAVVPVPENTTMGASTYASCLVCAAGTGLTLTGVNKTGPVSILALSRSVTGGNLFFNMTEKDLELQPNEGLIFYPFTTGVIGDSFTISVYWSEF